MADNNTPKAVAEFLAESEEILEEIGNSLIELEQGIKDSRVRPEVVNSIFRGAHSLKGLSGMLGFSKVSELSHSLEDMLDSLRLGKLSLSGDVADCLFESVDALNRLIGRIAKEGNDQIGIEAELSRIHAVLQGGSEDSSGKESPLSTLQISPSVLEVLTEYEEHRLLENIRQGARLFEIRVTFSLDTFDQDLQILTSALSGIGEIITTLPSTGESPESGILFNLVVGTEVDEARIREAATSEDVEIREIEYERKEPEPSTEKEPSGEKPASSGLESQLSEVKGISKTVRVDITKLDSLMNLVGELIQSKNVLQRIEKELKQQKGFSGTAIELHKVTEILERKLSELQDGVLGVRMIPIGQVFNRLARVVRKLSKASGKKISFITSGESTELDKLIIEEIADPLMHIIRNAIDHGIESPAERKKSGKPETGTIHLNAYQKGNRVAVEIQDDGAGINTGRLIRKAVEMGQIQEDEVLDEEQARNLIFLPGLSTAEKVTEVSGRGVGMDVVKNNITALGGMIDIESEPGRGTCFLITLPITLAIIPALIIRCSDRIFAIPLNAVSENLIVPNDALETVEKREVIQLRERTLPLLRLQEIFHLPPTDGNTGKSHIVVTGLAEKKIGLIVDEFIDKQEIVIKPIGKALKRIPGIAGATELGDRQAILVLDAGSLIEEATMGVKKP